MMSASTAMEVRALPFRVRPLPDEPFDSWVETLAATNRATIVETARALGLIGLGAETAGAMTSWMASQWATELTDAQAAQLELSTRIPASQFHEMTRIRFARHAVRYTRQGRISSRCPVGGTGGRYCPDCLLDSGGRWRMSWQFPFVFACARHRRILLDRCPACQRQPRRTGHPLAVIPVPGQCHNPVQGAANGPTPNRCRADLTATAERIHASDAVLHAQRLTMRILSTGISSFGMYEGAPQPAISVLEDIRLLSRTARLALAAGDTLDMPDVGAPLLEALRAGRVDTSWSGPSTSVGAAVGNAIAVAALEDPARVVALMAGRLAVSTSYTAHTPQLQSLVAKAFGRTRRPTVFLQSAHLPESDADLRAGKVPAQLWDGWTDALAPRRLDREIAASALAAAVVFTGTRLTHSAALALLDSRAPARQVTNVMRELGRGSGEEPTLRAILGLVAYLDTHDTPIDYARRRRLDCTTLLPAQQWQQLCAEANVSPGSGARHRQARGYLHRLITGNPPARMPSSWEADDVTVSTLATFARRLPTDLRAALMGAAAHWLQAHGIHEPVTWTPLAAELTNAVEIVAGREPGFATARPARAAAADVIEAEEIAGRYRAGASTSLLADETGVSRQTVSRLLGDTDTPTRRGRPATIPIDEGWLREKYETELLTIRQVASIAGCSTHTINQRLRDAGIPIRPGGAGSEAAALHPHPLAGDSPLLRRTLVGRNAVERAHRFLLTTRHTTLLAAAREIGTTQSSLGAQLGRLSSDAGGPILVYGSRARPMTLTPLGRKLARELEAALSAG